MALTEAQRVAMYQSMRSVHGTDIAETIMSIYPPGDGNEIATTRDLVELQAVTRADMGELRTDLRAEMAELRTDLRTEMAELRTGLRAEMAELRTEMADLRTEMAELRTDLRTDMATMKSDLLRTLGTWLFASQAGVVSAVALVMSLMNR